jgi:hypothetical protein
VRLIPIALKKSGKNLKIYPEKPNHDSGRDRGHVHVLFRNRKRDSTGEAGGLLSTKDQKSDGRAGGENRGLSRINR